MEPIWRAILIFHGLSNWVMVTSLELSSCSEPLGLESGIIPDAFITASSSYDTGSVGPQFARLKQEKNGGAWCPKQQVMKGVLEWLEVDLHSTFVVTSVLSQGRFGNGQGVEYVEEYRLEYQRPSSAQWIAYKDRGGNEILPGNTNTYTVVENRLDPIIIASKIRVIPFSLHRRTVCLRLELIGCPWREGVLSYAMPQGDNVYDVDMVDTYDGKVERGYLQGGLGVLIDGQYGSDEIPNFFTGWIGWKNQSKPVEIVFEFDTIRNFSAVKLHTNNQFSKGIQVFSQAKIWFSVGGRHYQSDPIVYTYMPDLAIEKSRNVSIKLQHRVGKFIKFQLFFGSPIMMVSEVTFDSVPISKNFTHDWEAIQEGEISLQRDEGKVGKSDGREIFVGVNTEESQETGVVIGVMTVVIIALLGAIVTMSVRNCRQNVGILPTGFPGLKDFRFRMPAIFDSDGHNARESDNKTSIASPGEALYNPVRTEDFLKLDKMSVYHEPFRISPNYTGNYPLLKASPTPSKNQNEQPPVELEYAVPHYRVNAQPLFPPLTPSHHLTLSSHQSQNAYRQNTLGKPQPPPIPLTMPMYEPHLPSPPTVSPSQSSELQSQSEEQFYAATDLLKKGPTTPIRLMYNEPKFEDTDGESIMTEDDAYGKIEEIPCQKLQVLRRLGVGYFGQVNACEIIHHRKEDRTDTNEVQYAMLLKSHQASSDLPEEAKTLVTLKHPNVLKLLGYTCIDGSTALLIEYSACGDLYQFLQNHVAESANPNLGHSRTLSYGCLLYMARQVAAAMEYLEARNIVHRDLAARNCIMGENYHISISHFGMHRDNYESDYYKIPEGYPLPVRWMAWESVAQNKYTVRSDVWSFAVTLWEILTFAREQPFEHMSDDEVVDALMSLRRCKDHQLFLPRPILCPKEIYDLMLECWQRCDSDRPTFREIHMFLTRKNLGYEPGT